MVALKCYTQEAAKLAEEITSSLPSQRHRCILPLFLTMATYCHQKQTKKKTQPKQQRLKISNAKLSLKY